MYSQKEDGSAVLSAQRENGGERSIINSKEAKDTTVRIYPDTPCISSLLYIPHVHMPC